MRAALFLFVCACSDDDSFTAVPVSSTPMADAATATLATPDVIDAAVYNRSTAPADGPRVCCDSVGCVAAPPYGDCVPRAGDDLTVQIPLTMQTSATAQATCDPAASANCTQTMTGFCVWPHDALLTARPNYCLTFDLAGAAQSTWESLVFVAPDHLHPSVPSLDVYACVRGACDGTPLAAQDVPGDDFYIGGLMIPGVAHAPETGCAATGSSCLLGDGDPCCDPRAVCSAAGTCVLQP